jgi:hypothetical protein
MIIGWLAMLAVLLLSCGQSFASGAKLKLEISSEGEWIPYEEPSGVATAGRDDQATRPYFYVVLSSASDVPARLVMTKGEWWESLSFTITLANGREFSVSRPAVNRLNNYTEDWIIGKGRCRVFVVNLKTGDWRGLPKLSDLPDRKPMRIQAFFRSRSRRNGAGFEAQSEPVDLRP